jgi:hypothetical protein
VTRVRFRPHASKPLRDERAGGRLQSVMR